MTNISSLPIVRTVAGLRQQIGAWRKEGDRIALIPTMGALHEGHMTLVRRARELASRVVVSVFVNPIQFGPNEDFAAYPRREEKDAALLVHEGASLLYAPTAEEMYAQNFSTSITVAGLSEGLCGAFRPVHFSGVATVVTKLLLQAGPDVALFGEKDYQQLQIVRRMVRDLNIPVEIVGVPTVREADGLARSSRNAYLTPQERLQAPALHRTLAAMADALAKGAEITVQIAWGQQQLLNSGFSAIDYLEVRDADTLVPLERITGPARILAAAHLGKTRLIDNQPVSTK